MTSAPTGWGGASRAQGASGTARQPFLLSHGLQGPGERACESRVRACGDGLRRCRHRGAAPFAAGAAGAQLAARRPCVWSARAPLSGADVAMEGPPGEGPPARTPHRLFPSSLSRSSGATTKVLPPGCPPGPWVMPVWAQPPAAQPSASCEGRLGGIFGSITALPGRGSPTC